MANYDFRYCNQSGCRNKIANHRWGRTKAQTDGWFEQTDGQLWCPKHVPSWVAPWREWRKSKGLGKPNTPLD